MAFVETISSKDELYSDFKEFATRKFELGQNALLAFYGFTHGKALTSYCSNNLKQLMEYGGIPYTSVAYFQAGIKAWENFNNGLVNLPELVDNGVSSSTSSAPIPTPSFTSATHLSLLTALRTKPFVLLAGISGTGKSRIVKELAYASCPSDLREPNNEPGNYCMIEVKPNWHDSTELLGYFSTISQKYMITNFIRFVHKASLRKVVPFFVCLDEMNLAPVEQYFAEYLSVLESRKRLGGDVVTGQILKKDNFSKCDLLRKVTDGAGNSVFTENLYSVEDEVVINYLKNNGLSIPSNLFVIGTVNMDDTTHQFSRKVIDRAMTIEMNGGELMDMFGGSVKLDFCENPMSVDCFRPRYVNADEVIDAHSLCAEKIKELTVKRLKAVNESLSETPFQVSYRVLNELVICLGNLLDDNGYQGDGSDDDFEKMVADAVDNIAIMKILPRIEGDDQLLGDPDSNDCKLKQLQGKLGSKSSVKITEMISRLRNSSFTRFWA